MLDNPNVANATNQLEQVKLLIAESFAKKHDLNNQENIKLKQSLIHALKQIFLQLENGNLRVAEKIDNSWHNHTWVKQAILLSFIVNHNQLITSSTRNYFDKISPRFVNASLEEMQSLGARVVPPACIRSGSYIGSNAVIMPSYVNTGAYVDDNSMVDTWATIGSCAQIGKNVHVGAGVTIGGVLEPMQSFPTIIEDNCFIGTNSSIVEGVIIEENSVIASGVNISGSTKIYNRATDEITYGKIPTGSVIVPGSLPSPGSSCHTYCAVIAKTVDQKTLSKIAINDILREV